jgi:predicted transposase YbfD/YdcC
LPDKNPEHWRRLKTLIRVDACRTVKEKETKETRYYISDEEGMSAACYNALVRGHRGIGNHLHWHLDVTFKEDASRAGKGHAPENLSTLRKLALQIINEQKDRLSLRKRRLIPNSHITQLWKLMSFGHTSKGKAAKFGSFMLMTVKSSKSSRMFWGEVT